jgi:hypothetical protein
MSRLIYPVIYAVEYNSGRIDNLVCAKGWESIQDSLKKAKASGSVKDFRFTTALDRRLRSLIATPRGVITASRVATKQPAKIKHRRTWRRS